MNTSQKSPAALATTAFYALQPDPSVPEQRIAFGTSGHRGRADLRTFNAPHVRAIAQAIAENRAARGVTGPLYLGGDTHALSAPAFNEALRVLVACGVRVRRAEIPVPTPLISRAILAHNALEGDLADGIVMTPSHNPPEDGGFKYNPAHGGPAESEITAAIQQRANELLAAPEGISLIDLSEANGQSEAFDFVTPYVAALPSVIDMEAVARVKFAVHPLGGSSLAAWRAIRDQFGLDLEIVSEAIDPDFAFMPPDHDGLIRMDCSSAHAMAEVIELAKSGRYAFVVGNDPDADRHGVATASGLLNANHFLSLSVQHLLSSRDWPKEAVVARTAVTSALIDRVAAVFGRGVLETPVGFKFFAAGLHDGTICFAGEESAGASLLRRDGGPWCTDKDGIVLGLLAAEICAKEGDLDAALQRLFDAHGRSHSARSDSPATGEDKAALAALLPADVAATTLGGEEILRVSREAIGGGDIGGIKVSSQNHWFAARPSGTEPICKIYAESLSGDADMILQEAKLILGSATPR